MDADQRSHIRSVHNLVDRARTHHQRWRIGRLRRPLRAVEKKLARQVQDHLHAAAGQDALAGVSRGPGLGIPQRTNKPASGARVCAPGNSQGLKPL